MEENLMTENAATTTEGTDASNTVENAVVENAAASTNQEQSTEEVKGAPETYETFKVPEGSTFDEHTVSEFSQVAKELNLSQDDAQKVIDKVAPALVERQQQLLKTASEEWRTASTNDQEFGGAKLDQNLSIAVKALDEFGTPALRDLLNETGFANHPEIIRFMYRAGKALSEDKVVSGKTPQGVENDMARRLFPNQA